jgi:outer membrane protein insertion porin family
VRDRIDRNAATTTSIAVILLLAAAFASPGSARAATPLGETPLAVATGSAGATYPPGFDPTPFLPYAGYVVSAIHLQGNKVTRNYVVTREIHTKTGQPLDVETLSDDFQRLENIQVFSQVTIVPSASDSTVALVFDLKEMPKVLVYPALSFTDQNGWSYGAGASSINVQGRNISTSLKALFGGNTALMFNLSDPWITGNHLSAKLNVAHQEMYDQFDEFNETDNYVVGWLGTYVRKYGRAGLGLGWLQVNSDVPGNTLDPDDTDNFYVAGIYLTYDSRESVRNPDNGWYANFQEQRYNDGVHGQGVFWFTSLDLRKYARTFGSQILSIGGFAQFQSGVVGVNVPDYLQFRMGGANSIRGYDLDSLGQTLYGKNQFIVTTEYSFQLRPIRQYAIFKWTFSLGLSAAVFADNGIAWSQGSDFNTSRNRIGGGAGLRVLVPGMGMIRFDFAQGEGGGFAFNFATGFKFDAQTKRVR